MVVYLVARITFVILRTDLSNTVLKMSCSKYRDMNSEQFIKLSIPMMRHGIPLSSGLTQFKFKALFGVSAYITDIL